MFPVSSCALFKRNYCRSSLKSTDEHDPHAGEFIKKVPYKCEQTSHFIDNEPHCFTAINYKPQNKSKRMLVGRHSPMFRLLAEQKQVQLASGGTAQRG